MNSPIYKDYFYTASTASLEYYIVADGNVIFRGKAWRNPDTGLVKINVGEIVRDYMSFDLPDFRTLDDVVTRQEDAYRVFELYSASGSKLDEYKVLFDWYGEWNGETKVLSNPIDGVLDPRMKIVWTIFSPTAIDVIMENIPSVINTFFTPVTNPIRISFYGGDHYVGYLTNYYPYTDIGVYASNGDRLTWYGESFSGRTITFQESPVKTQDREYTLYFYYGDSQDVIGTIDVIQEKAYLNPTSPTITVPTQGGNYTVLWETNVNADNLCVYVNGASVPVTVNTVTSSGCTITVGRNEYTADKDIYLDVYYCEYGTPEEDEFLGRQTITSRGISQDEALYINELYIPGQMTPAMGPEAAFFYGVHNAPRGYAFATDSYTSNYIYVSGITTDDWFIYPNALILETGRTYGMPIGYTPGNLQMIRRDTSATTGYITLKVTSTWGTNTNPTTTPTGTEIKDHIRLAPKQPYRHGGITEFITNLNFRDSLNNGYCYGLYENTTQYDYNTYAGIICWRTIIADGYAAQPSEYVNIIREGENPQYYFEGVYFEKTARSNSIGLRLSGHMTAGPWRSGCTLELGSSEYVGYAIENYDCTGPIDIYIQDTKDWFLSIPRQDQRRSNTYVLYNYAQTHKARWFVARTGYTDTITVHCTDGDVIWTADEYMS